MRSMRNNVETYLKSNTNIVEQLKDWVKNELECDNDGEYYQVDGVYDVYDINIISIDVEYQNFLFTYKDDECVSIEAKYKVEYEVNILTDDEETMYKDDDTKEWCFFDTKWISIKESKEIMLDINLFIEEDKINDENIESINKGKGMKILNSEVKTYMKYR